jgi:hypothetical protein
MILGLIGAAACWFVSSTKMKTGNIEIVTTNDNYRKYTCDIFEAESVLAITINAAKEITLQIFTSVDKNGKIWYSMAIDPNAFRSGEIKGTTENQRIFQNLLGIMKP